MGTRHGMLALLVAALAAGAGTAGSVTPSGRAPDENEVRLEELGLTLTLPPLEGLAGAGTNRWSGRLGASKIDIRLSTLDGARFPCAEPDQVLELGPSHWASPDQARNEPGQRHALEGAFGYARYAVWERTVLRARDTDAAVGLRFLLGGLLASGGYWITVEASPVPAEAHEALLFEFLTQGIAYDGPVREHRWSDEEAEERWRRDAPPATHEKLAKPIRTAHYIVLTDSSGGKSFGAKMEECHAAIRKVFPFDDVEGRRLMPVFLFRTPEEYYQFYESVAGLSREEAERSKGHAWRDYYATWYDAPGDPVHIHEATHQIFANRLGLGGGGSWFQEGVAEYMSTRPGDRSAAAGLVKKQKHVPLERFVTIQSLLYAGDPDAPQGDEAEQNYKLAALLIEFLREDKWARERFPAFLQRVGRLSRGDRIGIEAAVEDLYGVGLAGLEERWVAYCKKR